MRVAALQWEVVRDGVEANLRAVEEGLRAAARAGVELLVLPEMWPTSFPDAGADPRASLAASEAAVERAAALAGTLGILLCGSSFGAPECAEGDPPARRLANRLRLHQGGECVLAYDKVHLFTPTAEGESFLAGSQPPPTVDTGTALVSGVICYDLRFPELTRWMFRSGAEIVAVPAQWPGVRAAHLRALVAGLAAWNQCFVVAANRLGTERIGRRGLELGFPGNSLIAAPDGTLLAEGRGEPGLVVADVDPDLARQLRRSVPVARDRRPELYAAWESEEGALSPGF